MNSDAVQEVTGSPSIAVTQAFVDLLRPAPVPVIVNVSSSSGSLTLQSDPTWKYYAHKGAVYSPSKSALNMCTLTLASELRETPFKVNAVDPGLGRGGEDLQPFAA